MRPLHVAGHPLPNVPVQKKPPPKRSAPLKPLTGIAPAKATDWWPQPHVEPQLLVLQLQRRPPFVHQLRWPWLQHSGRQWRLLGVAGRVIHQPLRVLQRVTAPNKVQPLEPNLEELRHDDRDLQHEPVDAPYIV